MTDNIPPEIADRLSDDDLRDIAENGRFSAPSMAKEILAFRSAPAPVRISPEVRRVLLDALLSAEDDVWNDSSDAEIVMARAFVEALP